MHKEKPTVASSLTLPASGGGLERSEAGGGRWMGGSKPAHDDEAFRRTRHSSLAKTPRPTWRPAPSTSGPCSGSAKVMTAWVRGNSFR